MTLDKRPVPSDLDISHITKSARSDKELRHHNVTAMTNDVMKPPLTGLHLFLNANQYTPSAQGAAQNKMMSMTETTTRNMRPL